MPEIERKEKITALIFALALSVVLIDRITKIFVCGRMSEAQSIPVIPGIFHITLVLNKGIAFGLFRNGSPLFAFLCVGVIGLILVYLLSKKRSGQLAGFSCALLIGGAAGNLIDRLIFGHVIDFLDFRVWPVFNVADSAITVGAALIAWSFIRNSKPHASHSN